MHLARAQQAVAIHLCLPSFPLDLPPTRLINTGGALVQVDINTEVGVVHDVRLQELRLYTDYGRCCRPLFIVENQQLRLTKAHIRDLSNREVTGFNWTDMVKQGFIECGAPSS